MRIFYVFHDYRRRRKKYGEVMQSLGHEVLFFEVFKKVINNKAIKRAIKCQPPDLFFILTPHYLKAKMLDEEIIAYLKAKSIPIVTYTAIDRGIPENKNNEAWGLIDFFFSQHKGFTDYLKERGVNAFYLPMGFYPDQYYPLKEKIKETIPISFMGSPQGSVELPKDKRVKYVKSLKKQGIRVFGNAFNERGVVAEKFSTHGKQIEIYSKSKINLDLPFINCPHSFYADMSHFKNRFFEVPATRNFLLTVRCPEFIEILGEDMVGYYDDNIPSLREAVAKYLKDDKLRKQMVKRAYKEVMSKHTFKHRFQEMFKIIS